VWSAAVLAGRFLTGYGTQAAEWQAKGGFSLHWDVSSINGDFQRKYPGTLIHP
jgi:hypothetical protein